MIKLGTTEITTLPGIDRVLLGREAVYGSRVPPGYTEVEYIENTSNAYLDTGITPEFTVTKITAQGDSSMSSSAVLMGTSTAGGHWIGRRTDGYWGNGNQSLAVSVTTKSNLYINIKNKSILFSVDGGTVYTVTASNSVTASAWLFAGNASGNTYPFKGKIYGDVIITKSGLEVFHGIPCKNSSDVAGWYDIVSRTFKGSSNATPFVAGPILPEGYTELQYVTTDSSAWIDTGVTGAKDLEVNVKFLVGTYVQYGAIYGNYVSESYKCNRAILASQTYLYVAGGDNLAASIGGFSINNVHELSVKKTEAYINGTRTGISASSQSDNTTNICLGANKVSNPSVRNIGLRIYSFQIKKEGAIILDYVPCVRDADSIAGFYDLKNRVFVRSSTATDFTAGPSV